MHRATAIGLCVLSSALLLGCSNKLTGELDISGTKFEPVSCKSGQGLGFSGVELTGKDGSRFRVAQSASGEGFGIYFKANETTGVELGKCGPFQIETQNSTINNIKNVKGSANVECAAGDVKVKGSVTFENCH